MELRRPRLARKTVVTFARRVVPGVGLEPTLHFWNQILSLERLPFRQPGDWYAVQ